MPISGEVKRLGRRWPAILERAEAFAEAMPEAGMSLAAFGGLALADVSPHDVPGVVRALAAKRIVWLRRNRSEVLVFAKRPGSITGLVGGVDPAEACLAACAPHLCGVTRALTDREDAKAASDFVGAEAARDRLSASCERLVAIVRGHVARGLPLDAFRAVLWANIVPSTLEAIANHEPAFSRGNKASLAVVRCASKKRIPTGLASSEKVAALVGKAGLKGITKTGLLQGIRPKPKADDLAAILEGLAVDGRIEASEVRIGSSTRSATRFFAVGG